MSLRYIQPLLLKEESCLVPQQPLMPRKGKAPQSCLTLLPVTTQLQQGMLFLTGVHWFLGPRTSHAEIRKILRGHLAGLLSFPLEPYGHGTILDINIYVHTFSLN